jgi:hypothetical protein
VGGLRVAVADGRSGLLVPDHDPATWAGVLGALLDDPARRAALAVGAGTHAAGFGWPATGRAMRDLYAAALAEHRARLLRAAGLFDPALVDPALVDPALVDHAAPGSRLGVPLFGSASTLASLPAGVRR